MPHLLIEYSANVDDHHDVEAMVDAAHRGALATGWAPLSGMRTRAARREVYRIADGHEHNAFVSMQMRIGPGRDLETKQQLVTAVLDAAQGAIDESDGPLAIAWSIELTEIDADIRINRNNVAVRLEAGAS